MEERRLQEQIAKAQLGADMRDFCKHPGFTVLLNFLQSKVTDQRKDWLSAPSAQVAEEIRIKAKPYLEIENYLKRLIVEGDNAAASLHAEREESI